MPGASPGILTIDGDYKHGAGGVLVVEVAGVTAGSEYDVLQITGDATLAGTLQVQIPDGTFFAAGSTFDVLTADEIVGFFDILDLPLDALGDPLFDVQIIQSNSMAVRMTALQTIPEPPVGTLMVAGMLSVFLRRCRGKKPGGQTVSGAITQSLDCRTSACDGHRS